VLAITCQFCTYRRTVSRSTRTGGPLLVMVEQATDEPAPEAKQRTA